MTTQLHLIRVWAILSQWLSQFILFLAARRSIRYMALVACALGLFLLSMTVLRQPELSALYSQGIYLLQQLHRFPFSSPLP